MIFEPARPGDAVPILRILRDTFDPHLLPCVPLGCSGAEAYLEDIFHSPLRPLDTAWIVARDNKVRAFVEFRLFPTSLFLNYLHVEPNSQNQGIGARLFAASLDQLVSNRDLPITLDVSEANPRAKTWYERIGFKQKTVAIWKKFPLKNSTPVPDFFISGIPQADRLHEIYGFSSLTIETEDGNFEVGRLSHEIFRTTDLRLVNNPILRAIDPRRELLVISPNAPDGGQEISRRARLTASTAEVHKALIRS